MTRTGGPAIFPDMGPGLTNSASARNDEVDLPPPPLWRQWAGIAPAALRAFLYVGLILWACGAPAGPGRFILTGFVFGDITSWVLCTLIELPMRASGFAIEVAGFAGLLLLLGATGPLQPSEEMEGGALAIVVFSYLVTAFFKIGAFWTRLIAGELAD